MKKWKETKSYLVETRRVSLTQTRTRQGKIVPFKKYIPVAGMISCPYPYPCGFFAPAGFPYPIEEATKFNRKHKQIVAKMTSHAIFQYNVLVIDMDNTTLGLI